MFRRRWTRWARAVTLLRLEGTEPDLLPDPPQRGGRAALLRHDAGHGQQLRQTRHLGLQARRVLPASARVQGTFHAGAFGHDGTQGRPPPDHLHAVRPDAVPGECEGEARRRPFKHPAILPPTSVGLPGDIGAERPPIQHVYDEFVRVEDLDGPARWLEDASNARRLP